MKRFLAVAALLALALSVGTLLYSCGGKNDEPAESEFESELMSGSESESESESGTESKSESESESESGTESKSESEAEGGSESESESESESAPIQWGEAGRVER